MIVENGIAAQATIKDARAGRLKTYNVKEVASMLNLCYATVAMRCKAKNIKKTGWQYELTDKDIQKIKVFPRKQRKSFRVDMSKEFGVSENMLRNVCSRSKLGFHKDREYIRIAMAMYKTGWFKYKGIRALVKQEGILKRLGI